MIVIAAILTMAGFMACMFTGAFSGNKNTTWTVVSVVIFFVSIMWIATMSTIDAHCPDVDINVPIYPIDTDVVSGEKIHISSAPYFDIQRGIQYWVKDENSFKKEVVALENSTFVEDDTSLVHITGRLCDSEFYQDGLDRTTVYEFHVPEGTVLRMYEIERMQNETD